jgi:uncharacterized protein (UPF0305 family)
VQYFCILTYFTSLQGSIHDNVTGRAIPGALEPIGSDTAERHKIMETAARISSAGTRGELGNILADEILRFSLFDLQLIGGIQYREVEKLPSPYREAIRPFFREQLFGMHHQLIAMHRSGAFLNMRKPISNTSSFNDFCRMIPEGCFSVEASNEKNLYYGRPRFSLFYYLISAFTMFVLDLPGHPVGMPFPGGFRVEKRGPDYYCLIRDKEKDVFYSICNFCPAKQSEHTAFVVNPGV